MRISKARGQWSGGKLELDLSQNVFAHCQLYSVVYQETDPRNLTVSITREDSETRKVQERFRLFCSIQFFPLLVYREEGGQKTLHDYFKYTN